MASPVKIWRNQKHIKDLLGKEGSIVAWTVIRVPQAGFSHFAPYPVVIVSVPDYGTGTFQMVDCDLSQLVVGGRVQLVIRRIMEPTSDGVIPYGIKAKPI